MTTQDYYQQHQRSFRCAFDFLNRHFPPGEEIEWWEQVTREASKASAEQKDNKLTMELLGGVMNYLEYEWKRRRQEHGEAEH